MLRLTEVRPVASASRRDAAANAARENICYLKTRQHATGRAEMDRTGGLRYGGSALATNYRRGRSGHTHSVKREEWSRTPGVPTGRMEDNSREAAYARARSARVGAAGTRASCTTDHPRPNVAGRCRNDRQPGFIFSLTATGGKKVNKREATHRVLRDSGVGNCLLGARPKHLPTVRTLV